MYVRIPTTVGAAPNIEVVKWLMWAARNAGIADARNQICEDFLASEEDLLWMIDSDVVCPPRALKGDMDILCGVYPHMIHNFGKPAIVWSAWTAQDDGYVPAEIKDSKHIVDAAATGCMRLTRKVLKEIPAPWFENHFEEGSRHLALGEDYDFCRKAKNAGFPVWIDPKYQCHHMKQASLAMVEQAVLNTLSSKVAA